MKNDWQERNKDKIRLATRTNEVKTVSTLQTKLEQILCSRGYSDMLAGVGAALIIFAGFLASFPIGLVSMKTGRLILISRQVKVFELTSFMTTTRAILMCML